MLYLLIVANFVKAGINMMRNVAVKFLTGSLAGFSLTPKVSAVGCVQADTGPSQVLPGPRCLQLPKFR
jgi:hypothetical protein